MTVIVSDARLASMKMEGVENNPVVGIRDVFQQAGTTFPETDSGARATDGATYTFYTDGGPTAFLRRALTGTAKVSMAGIASHNLGTIGASITPEYYDGSAWVALGRAAVPTNDQTIVWLFTSVEAGGYRFKIENITGTMALGVAFFGQTVTFDQRFYQEYDEARFKYPTRVDLLANQTGPHVLGTSVLSRGSSVEWSFEHLTEDSVFNNDFRAWVEDYNEGRGFFSAWRPQDYGTAYYGWREGDPIRIVNSGPRRRKSLAFRMKVYDE